MNAEVRRVALVVEDEPTLERSIDHCLEGMHFDVVSASNYENAVRALAARTPDLVCLELGLPDESGLELCEYIRALPGLDHAPILVLSDRSLPEDKAAAEEAGANAFLVKPFSMRRLEKYVHAIVDDPRATQPDVCRLRVF